MRIALEGGVALGLTAGMFAVVGLSPSFSWVPEAPLLAAGAILPGAILVATAVRTGTSLRSAALSAAGAGAIGGLTGGLAYVAFGKAALNIPIGLLAGMAAGLLIGAMTYIATRFHRHQP